MPNLRYTVLTLALIGTVPACTSTAPPSVPAAPATSGPAASPRGVSQSALLYVTDEGNVIYVYSYPKGRLLQKLDTLQSATGECLDGGNVFVTFYNGHNIAVYAHGASKPSVVLPDPGYPVGCSIDPATQTLAVANGLNRDAGKGNVVLWKPTATAIAPAAIYSNLPFEEPFWCSYDNEGNLFVDGEDYSTRSVSLVELPKGGSVFKTISLDISLGWPPGHVQWDGRYITISVANVIYRLSFTGSTAYVVGSTQLPAYWKLQGYSIVGAWQSDAKHHKLVGTAGGSIGFFDYPSGSGPHRALTQNYPFDAVVSPASRLLF
jgi:hypothetical protein